MTADDFRRIALSFPEASESAHMGHPDFRVRNKIFATLGYPDAGRGMVKLTPEQQHDFIHLEPDAFTVIDGTWGRRGATHVHLKAASKASARKALEAAWSNTAPKKLAEQYKPKA